MSVCAFEMELNLSDLSLEIWLCSLVVLVMGLSWFGVSLGGVYECFFFSG